jgi:hypothetical protein
LRGVYVLETGGWKVGIYLEKCAAPKVRCIPDYPRSLGNEKSAENGKRPLELEKWLSLQTPS